MKKELIDIEFDEVIELESPVEVVEEYLDVDNSLVEMEKNRDLIRMEMNIVEYPIFSKNKRLKKNQIMKYHFKTDGSAYIEVTPLVNRTIPGEFEERVFISLTKIMRDNGYGRTFYTTPTEIIRNLGEEFEKIPSVYYKKVKEALNKMNESNYKFKNSLYSNEYKKTLEDEIKTNIMNIRIVSKIDASGREEELFEDGRIKEIYKISFSDYFYENIVRKGYLVFNSEDLLKIKDAVTRSVYTQITKWRNNKLYLKRPAFYIARRIPLKWDKKNLARTVKRMEESCILLKEMGFLKDYRVIKNKKWEQAEFEFYFDEEHNRIQQENFFKEREDFRIAYVEEKDLKETQLNEDKKPKVSEEKTEKVQQILGLLPPQARKLNSLNFLIEKALEEHDFEYVLGTAEYTSLNCKKSYKRYFEEALKNYWAEEYIINKEDKKKKLEKKITKSNEENKQKQLFNNESEKLWKLYEEKPEIEKEEIRDKAYNFFLEELNQLDNKLNRDIFAKANKAYILKVLNGIIIENRITKSNEEIKITKLNEEIKLAQLDEEKIETQSNEEIFKKEYNYESMSMFLFDVIEVLEKHQIEEIQKIIKIIPLLNEFSGTINGKRLYINYKEDGKGLIEISRV